MTVCVLTGDARELLQTITCDVIVTDPVWPNCPSDLLQGADDPDGLWRETMAVLPDVRRMVVILRGDSDPRFLRHVPERLPFFRAITMDYAMPGYIGRKLGAAELAYWFGGPIAFAPGRGKSSPVARLSRSLQTGHRTATPAAVLKSTWIGS